MECQTCTRPFPSSTTLYDHINFFRSKAQYHARELQRCIEHISESGNDGYGFTFTDASAAEYSDLEELQCPEDSCHRNDAFGSLKELERHFATHIPCSESCSSCGHLFRQTSSYLHHACKKTKGRTSNTVRRRRSALRDIVRTELRKMRTLKEKTSRVQPVRKRQRVEVEVENHDAESAIDAILGGSPNKMSCNPQVSTHPTQIAAESAFDAASSQLGIHSSAQDLQPASTFSNQSSSYPAQFPKLHMPAGFTGSRAPLIYSGKMFSKAPLMSPAVMLTKAPLMNGACMQEWSLTCEGYPPAMIANGAHAESFDADAVPQQGMLSSHIEYNPHVDIDL